jgi:hypothetical protein
MIQPLYSGERDPSIRWIGGCLAPTAGMDAVAKKKISFLPLPGIEPNRSADYID